MKIKMNNKSSSMSMSMSMSISMSSLIIVALLSCLLLATEGFAPKSNNNNNNNKYSTSSLTKSKSTSSSTSTTTLLKAEIGDTGVVFENVAREWRCKYSPGPSGGPDDSESLKKCQSLLDEFLPKLKELPGVTITRQVCGGCLDFKISISQPLQEHGTWADANYEPLEEEFMSKLKDIDGTSFHETQEITFQIL